MRYVKSGAMIGMLLRSSVYALRTFVPYNEEASHPITIQPELSSK